MKERILEVDFVKGVLISLMVLFHFKMFVNTYVGKADDFLEDYKVSKLPRFVLIGKDGKFVAPWFFSPTHGEQLHYVLNYMLGV